MLSLISQLRHLVEMGRCLLCFMIAFYFLINMGLLNVVVFHKLKWEAKTNGNILNCAQ